MRRLQKFLDKQDPSAPLADRCLIHTANGEDFLDILESGKIIPSECRVFNREKLSYFFLGRPAYKTSVNNNPAYWQLPAVFHVRRIADVVPKRVYPFDTGAHHEQKYREIIGRLKMDDFEIDPAWASVSKLVKYFFGSIDNYESGESIPYQTIRNLIGNNTSEFVPLALAKLYNHPTNEEIDDRVKLVEFQYDVEIELNSENIVGVIICKEWLRDPYIEKKLDSLGCQVKKYPIFPLSSSSYYSKIYELSQEII